ncbi:MAG: cytochrome c maturation protein CcmE [Actinomycetota bacterium]
MSDPTDTTPPTPQADEGLDLSPRSEAPAPTGAPKRKRNIVPMLVLAGALIAGGVVVTQFLSSAVDFFCNVDEVGVRDGCEEDRRIRLQGTVDEGTVVSAEGQTRFSMTFNETSIDVVYDGDPGGIFQECIPVVVHGEINQGVLNGDRLEVKHSDEYAAENDQNLSDAADQNCATADA